MVMINLRMNANVPLVIMGETGCGKTSLIRALAVLKKADMIIFNIHAGIDNNKILEFVKEYNLLEDNANKFKRDYSKIKNIWVFLDEVNTSNSLGLFAEMMIKRSILGKPIKKNVSFIAACNPYKTSSEIEKNYNNQIGLKVTTLDIKNIRGLAYSVNPLPYSLLNFVFSFGHLSNTDEEKYIINMVKRSLIKLIQFDPKIKDLNTSQQNVKIDKLLEIITKPIIHAQQFIRKEKGISSVSLRDVNRFVHFFEWFLQKKKENFLEIKINDLVKLFKEKEIKNDNNEIIEKIKKIDEYIFGAIMSLYVCYFLRLDSKDLRKKMNEKITEDLDIYNFEIFCQHIVRNLVDEIEIEKGIAKNRALLENLFALFICINNKIPLFLCGKPGCSKSLSLSIIEKAMRGKKKSESEKFKNIPEIARLTYQGSLTSTSEGVLNVFNNARNKLRNSNIKMERDIHQLKLKVINAKKKWKKMSKKERKNNLIEEQEKEIVDLIKEIKAAPKISDFIYMVYFDEMGLAEISPNNPLKVIHSQLEYEKEDEKLAFVGISNWTLDASKMNRGIYLAVSEPDENDCIETAKEIAKSYEDENLNKTFIDKLTPLSKAYYKYVSSNKGEYADFHGTRDFYNVIKLACRLFLNKNKNNLDDIEIIQNSIQRNFGGYENSINIFEKIYYEFDNSYPQSNIINIGKCIEENILDEDGRYLMLISDTSKSQYLIQYFLKSVDKFKTILIGSKFEKDSKSEKYAASLLQKIQGAMRNGEIIIMNNLEPIYPSLYDLFNQNFVEICERQYARITIGSSTDSLFQVSQGFKCIVLVDPEKLPQQDKPFLNRFEKQVFSFKDLLNEEENNFVNDVFDIINFLIEKNVKKIEYNPLDLSTHLINFSLEEIRGIFYDFKQKMLSENENVNIKDKLEIIKDEILKKIAYNLSQDIMININYSSFKKKYEEEFKKIVDIYNTKPNNFEEFLNQLNENKQENKHKNIIFTFSRIFDNLESGNKDKIMSRIIDKTDNEKIISVFIEEFFNSDKNYLIIQIKKQFHMYLSHLQNLIDNYIKDKNINLEKKTEIYNIYNES